MTRFWQGWLVVWCAAVAVFGLVLISAAFAATDAPARAVLTLLGNTDPMTPVLRFALALMGAVSLGWSATIYAIVVTAGANARAWQLLTLGMVTWYVIDSSLSVATGFRLNAVSNTVFITAFLLPILRSGVLRPAH